MYMHYDGPHGLNIFLNSNLYPVSAQKMIQRGSPGFMYYAIALV